MSDLTRDEVRRACEALPGWQCYENPSAEPGAELVFWVTVGKPQDPEYQELFQTFGGEDVRGDYDDAMRMLEAWRTENPEYRGFHVNRNYQRIRRNPEKQHWFHVCLLERRPGLKTVDWGFLFAIERDLPTAAARAVIDSATESATPVLKPEKES